MQCGEDPKKNLAHQLALAEQALKKGAKIFCTQELFRSQYFCQIEDHRFFALAETIPGPSTDAFSRLAKKYQAVIIASLFEKRAAGVYHNTAAVIDADGSLMGVYRKMHIPDDPLLRSSVRPGTRLHRVKPRSTSALVLGSMVQGGR
jgi:N-carbamoylputrescine amidase